MTEEIKYFKTLNILMIGKSLNEILRDLLLLLLACLSYFSIPQKIRDKNEFAFFSY